MQNLDELRREAEEAKERLRRDILDLRDVLKRVARESGERGRNIADESLKVAETRIEEAVSQAEKRFETVLKAVTGCNLCYDDFVTRKLDISDFTNVEADCAFRVEIERADDNRVTIWASEELQPFVNAVKSGNTLKLSLKTSTFKARPIVHARIGMKQLGKIRLGGTSTGTVRGFTAGDHLDFNLSGHSVLEVDMATGVARGEVSGASRLSGQLKATSMELVLSGASRADLRGAVNDLTLNAWGASKVEMGDFAIGSAAVHLKGASETTLKVSEKLDIDLTGGSRLTYSGSPTIRTISVTGASSLTHK